MSGLQKRKDGQEQYQSLHGLDAEVLARRRSEQEYLPLFTCTNVIGMSL